ncbi:cytochrome C assembly family protein, partial [Vibrio parahaemolyticus V-223/04]
RTDCAWRCHQTI